MTVETPEPALQFTITPEPTTEEEGAIVATLTLMLASSRRSAPSQPAEKPNSRWSLAGREEAHHSSPTSQIRSWSRSRAWLEGTSR